MFKVSGIVWDYLGITTCFWEAVTFEYEKTAFQFYLQDILFFFLGSALSTVHTYHRVILPKWWCPGLQHIYLSLIWTSWFGLPAHCLFLLIYQNFASVAPVPPRQSWRFCQKKTRSQAIKPYLLKVLEERKAFAVRNYSF